MKVYELKIGKKNGEKTYWKTIGSLFCDDDCKILNANGKPATFCIDYPQCNGIVVRKETKKNDNANDSDTDDNFANNSSDSLPI